MFEWLNPKISSSNRTNAGIGVGNSGNSFNYNATYPQMPIFSGFNNFSTDCSFFNPSFIQHSSLFPAGYDDFSQPLYSSNGKMFGVKLDSFNSIFENARQKAKRETIAKLSGNSDNTDYSSSLYVDGASDESPILSTRSRTSRSGRRTTIKTKLTIDGSKIKYRTKVKTKRSGKTKVKTTSVVKPSKNTGLPNIRNTSITKLGYNHQKGQKLADVAMRNHVGFVGCCARYVKNAVQQAGLGDTGSGHGYQMGDVLSRNGNFKQISSAGVNLSSLPAGCVLVYGQGVAGYSRQYGHCEITTGTGQAVSDGITNNLRPNPTAIFIPV